MISVVIPSRLEARPGSKQLFVEHAIETVRAQGLDSQIIVGLDPGQTAKLDAEVVNGPRANLSAVLNAAVDRSDGEFIAVLEDDDEWLGDHLATSLRVLETADFVSSTQIVVDEAGEVCFINDFPCPNTWVMRRSVWQAVGGLSEEYAVHQDHDWLGRLTESQCRRAHLVEATAPISFSAARLCRPWLAKLGEVKPGIKLFRHSSPWPLVRRLHRAKSWTGRIRSGEANDISSDCVARIRARFGGTLPW
jgi:glycosyltransferase involved in cell wall biosynthesis